MPSIPALTLPVDMSCPAACMSSLSSHGGCVESIFAAARESGAVAVDSWYSETAGSHRAYAGERQG